MITDLKHYIHRQEEFFDKELCAQAVSELGRVEFQGHKFYNPDHHTYHTRSGDQELEVTWDNDNEVSTKDIITKGLWQAIRNYLDYIEAPWFSSWRGYTSIRFNKYMENRMMALHCDHIYSMFDGERKGIPILSIVGTLNDDYEGGEFIMFDDYEVPFKTGDVVMFPSVFLYPHRVEPVKKGIRYSYSSWVW